MASARLAITQFISIIMLVSCSPKNLHKWYEYEDWWNYCSNNNPSSEATVEDIGKEVNLSVNGQIHKVRLIDIDKDADQNNNKIHTTFEFSNILSDENGYSLATYWNNTTEGGNYDYKNSTIREALNGDTDDINWFRYYGTNHDANTNRHFATETNYKKSVLNMLPEDLTKEGVLKTPSKHINIDEGSGWEEEIVFDKLFLLSPREMGYDGLGQETYTFTYSYYVDHKLPTDAIRIKEQIKEGEGARSIALAGEDLAGEFKGKKFCYSGYNGGKTTARGGSYWLRSPGLANNDAWYIYEGGAINTSGTNYFALGLAPAFCI